MKSGEGRRNTWENVEMMREGKEHETGMTEKKLDRKDDLKVRNGAWGGGTVKTEKQTRKLGKAISHQGRFLWVLAERKGNTYLVSKRLQKIQRVGQKEEAGEGRVEMFGSWEGAVRHALLLNGSEERVKWKRKQGRSEKGHEAESGIFTLTDGYCRRDGRIHYRQRGSVVLQYPV